MPRPKPTPPAAPSRAGEVRSMTGYGRAEESGPAGRLAAEIRAVNGRFFKLSLKAPARYGAFEERVKALLARRGITRGSVDVSLFFDGSGGEAGAYRLDAAALKRYALQAREAAKVMKQARQVSLDALLALPGVVVRAESDEDLEAVWARCATALARALDGFEEMRGREGASLAADIRGRLGELRAHREALLVTAPAAKERALARFRERVARTLEQAGLAGATPAEGLEREVVILCDRMDVSEELARLESHLAQMEGALAQGGELGKKLDFLTQELFREINTLGSKAADEGMTHRVVDMKGLVEKIREQVQNLE